MTIRVSLNTSKRQVKNISPKETRASESKSALNAKSNVTKSNTNISEKKSSESGASKAESAKANTVKISSYKAFIPETSSETSSKNKNINTEATQQAQKKALAQENSKRLKPMNYIESFSSLITTSQRSKTYIPDSKVSLTDTAPARTNVSENTGNVGQRDNQYQYNNCSKTNGEIKEYAQTLHDALGSFIPDTKVVENILNNSGLNSYDMLVLSQQYGYLSHDNKRISTGYLMDDIDAKYFGQKQTEFIKVIAGALFDVAQQEKDADTSTGASIYNDAVRELNNSIDVVAAAMPNRAKTDNSESSNTVTSTMILGIRG